MISFINLIPSFYDLKEIKVIVSGYYIYEYVFFEVRKQSHKRYNICCQTGSNISVFFFLNNENNRFVSY